MKYVKLTLKLVQMGVGWLVIGFCFFQQEVLRKVTPGVPPRWGLLVAKVAVTLGVGHSSVTSFGAAPREPLKAWKPHR